MRKLVLALIAATLFGMAGQSMAKETAGTDVTETQKVMKGWSAKKMILGKPIYNEQNQKIGSVEDIIISPEKAISYAIIGVGGFLGMGEHYVAVPFDKLKMQDKKFMMPNATKEELKAMPKF